MRSMSLVVDLIDSRWVALTESTGSNRPFRRLRDQQRILREFLFTFTKGCLLSKVVSRKNNQERHRVSIARDF